MVSLPEVFCQLEGTWEGEQKIYDAESGEALTSYTTKVEMGVSPEHHCSNRITNMLPGGKEIILEFPSRMHEGVFEYENDIIKGKSTVIDDKTIIVSGETKGRDSSFQEILRYVSEDERVATAQLLEGGRVKRVRICFQKRTSPDGHFFPVSYEGWEGEQA